MTFYIDDTTTPVCTGVLTASTGTTSTAQCTVPVGNSYLGGTHTLTAVYSGDTNNAVATLNGTHIIQCQHHHHHSLALRRGSTCPNCPSTGVILRLNTVVTPLPGHDLRADLERDRSGHPSDTTRDATGTATFFDAY